jgi:hypothetical protein
MGLLRDHASLLKVALPACDNSGVYAIVLTSFPETKKEAADLCQLPLVHGYGGWFHLRKPRLY